MANNNNSKAEREKRQAQKARNVAHEAQVAQAHRNAVADNRFMALLMERVTEELPHWNREGER